MGLFKASYYWVNMGHFGLAHYVAWGKREKTSAGDEDNSVTQCDSVRVRLQLSPGNMTGGGSISINSKRNNIVF